MADISHQLRLSKDLCKDHLILVLICSPYTNCDYTASDEYTYIYIYISIYPIPPASLYTLEVLEVEPRALLCLVYCTTERHSQCCILCMHTVLY